MIAPVSIADDLKRDGGCRPFAATHAEKTARNAGVTVHHMLRDPGAKAQTARKALCRVLIGRGWTPDAIERHYGMPRGWANVPPLAGSSEWVEGDRPASSAGSGEHPVAMLPPAMTAEEKREDQRRRGLWPAPALVPTKPWMKAVEAADAHASSAPRALSATLGERVLANAKPSLMDRCQQPRSASADGRCGKLALRLDAEGKPICTWHASRSNKPTTGAPE